MTKSQVYLVKIRNVVALICVNAAFVFALAEHWLDQQMPPLRNLWVSQEGSE